MSRFHSTPHFWNRLLLLLIVGVLTFSVEATAQSRGRTQSGDNAASRGSTSRAENRRDDDEKATERTSRNEADRQATRGNTDKRDNENVGKRQESATERPTVNRQREPENAGQSREATSRGSSRSDNDRQERVAVPPRASSNAGRTRPDDRPEARRPARTPERIRVPQNDRRVGNNNRYVRRPHFDVRWPWEYRVVRGWKPKYRFRQVVVVDAGWAKRRHRVNIDVRTFYRHDLRHAGRDRAVVDIFLDRIELYANGRFIGAVDRFPGELDHVRATVYDNGRVLFDRSLFLVGDPRVGFEIISTRAYDGYVLDRYDRSHGYRAGKLDLRRNRVIPIRRSRHFDPYDFNGYAPISLLPEESGWLLDYGFDSLSGYRFQDYDDWDDEYYGSDESYYDDLQYLEPLQRNLDNTYRTARGIEVNLSRQIELMRIE
jgi:hypothetical protein